MKTPRAGSSPKSDPMEQKLCPLVKHSCPGNSTSKPAELSLVGMRSDNSASRALGAMVGGAALLCPLTDPRKSSTQGSLIQSIRASGAAGPPPFWKVFSLETMYLKRNLGGKAEEFCFGMESGCDRYQSRVRGGRTNSSRCRGQSSREGSALLRTWIWASLVTSCHPLSLNVID